MILLARLAEIPFFQGLPQWALVRVAESAEENEVPAGHDIVRQYDRARAIHFLVSGSVQVLIRVGSEDMLVGVLRQPGELIGWSAFRPPYRYTATIRCEEPSVIVTVRGDVIDELADKDMVLLYEMLRRVAISVTTRFERTRDLLRTLPRRGPVGADRR